MLLAPQLSFLVTFTVAVLYDSIQLKRFFPAKNVYSQHNFQISLKGTHLEVWSRLKSRLEVWSRKTANGPI